MLDDHWIRSFRLRCVPGVHLLVDRRQGFGFVDELLNVSVTWPGGEQGQRGQADVRLQRFPGLIAYKACNTNWMMLLDLSGDKAINSLSAAITIQVAGWLRTSTVTGAGVLLA